MAVVVLWRIEMKVRITRFRQLAGMDVGPDSDSEAGEMKDRSEQQYPMQCRSTWVVLKPRMRLYRHHHCPLHWIKWVQIIGRERRD